MADFGDDGPSGRGSAPLIDPQRLRVSRDEIEPGRAWNAKDWEEDRRYIEALELVATGNPRDAVAKLICLYVDDPSHLYGRAELLRLAMDLGIEEVVRQHVEWAVGFLAQQRLAQRACDAYRAARTRFPTLEWGEKALVQVLVCAERCDDRRVVVDATRFIIASHPTSLALPKALLACANVQHAQGRADLALQTLRHITLKFPLDPLSEIARRRLHELALAEG